MRRFATLTGAALVLLACETRLACALPPQQPLGYDTHDTHDRHKNTPDDERGTRGTRGAVACESSQCSAIGVDMMRQGGSAADAHVATTLCVGVIGMYHAGIGGGGFFLVRSPNGTYETVDFRETAPAAASQDMYAGNVLGSVFGGLAVGVPGELRGLEYLHSRYGTLPWKTVVMPAVHVARQGFPISEDHVRYMDAATSTGGPFLTDDPVWAEDFAPRGRRLALGETMTRKRYARTLETIAHEGVEGFYTGALAREIVDAVHARNGSLTLADLAGYTPELRAAVNTTFRGRRLFATGAPSSGAVVLSVLKTMEQFPVDDLADTNLTTHRFDEALRFGYGARSHFGDPHFVHGLDAREADLLSEKHAQAVRRAIRDDATLPPDAYNPAGTYAAPGHGTSHIVSADGAGMAVSGTTTINTLFGSLVMTPVSGVILNNQMNDFSIPQADNEFGYPPSPANFVRPGKRPLSSITPVMAEHLETGRLELVVGAAGGSRIISATAQVAWHVLDHARGMHAALRAPRLHDQLAPDLVSFEAGFDAAVVAAMAERGHNVTWANNWYSAVQGIRVHPDGRFDAAGEPRQHASGGDVF